MRSLIHLFKLRKNQVLNILLIICIFLEVVFLLLLCLIDWYLMAASRYRRPFLSWFSKEMKFVCSHSWGEFLLACNFWTVWPFSTKLDRVVRVSNKLCSNSFQDIRWPGRKGRPYLYPTAREAAGWALSFSHREFTLSSHRKHRQGIASSDSIKLFVLGKNPPPLHGQQHCSLYAHHLTELRLI